MKKIIVACGSGVATSQNVATRLQMMLEDKGVIEGYKIIPVDIKSIESEIKSADIYVSLVPEAKEMGYTIPVFDGIKFLTGAGADQELELIINEINN